MLFVRFQIVTKRFDIMNILRDLAVNLNFLFIMKLLLRFKRDNCHEMNKPNAVINRDDSQIEARPDIPKRFREFYCLAGENMDKSKSIHSFL